MFFHEIHYELGCKQCKSRRLPAFITLKTEKTDNLFSRDDLLKIMKNFSEISCENCGSIGNWICFKIYINNKNDIYDQFKINLFKEDGKIWGKPEDGFYSSAQHEIAFSLILKKIKEELSFKIKGQCFYNGRFF